MAKAAAAREPTIAVCEALRSGATPVNWPLTTSGNNDGGRGHGPGKARRKGERNGEPVCHADHYVADTVESEKCFSICGVIGMRHLRLGSVALVEAPDGQPKTDVPPGTIRRKAPSW